MALRRRKQALLVSLIGGGLVGLVRVLQGGHYVSDVVASGIIVWTCAELVLYLYNKFILGLKL